MNFSILNNPYSVIKLAPQESIPTHLMQSDELFSVSYTEEECSIVCNSNITFDDHIVIDKEDGWRCLKIEGVLDFALTGILANIATTLANHDISIFALSTFNTDYILIKEENLEKGITVLTEAGHHVSNDPTG
ncbi:ACT domain-containing protein [Gracilibacillus suaedae]|uniref:ACT domain-containing protein n=1 Tax=Gracilibacillus suaedae TaxID=2820273 RepID=UPI001ABDDBA0|nr:ACT domain-containing protein [Gracilibacillus suaedae]